MKLLITKLERIINNKTGKLFPSAMTITGYILIAFGILSMLTNPMVGLLVLLIGCFISLSETGVLIDIEKKQYMDYASYFWIKKGKWLSFADYPYVAILRKKISTKAYSRANVSMTTNSQTCFDVCLLNKTHRRRIIIGRYTDREEAKGFAKKMEEMLSVKFTSYDPVISEATKAKL